MLGRCLLACPCTVNVQKERKNLIDDLPPVDSVGKFTDG